MKSTRIRIEPPDEIKAETKNMCIQTARKQRNLSQEKMHADKIRKVTRNDANALDQSSYVAFEVNKFETLNKKNLPSASSN